MSEGMTTSARLLNQHGRPVPTIQQRREALQRYQRGESSASIARSLGISAMTVKNWAAKAGTKRIVSAGGKLTVRERDEIIERVRSGQSLNAVARATNTALSTVWETARRAGVVRSRREGQLWNRHSADTPQGRRHQEIVRRIVRLELVEGWGCRRIARAIGVVISTIQKHRHSCYAEALRSYVYNVVDNPRKRVDIARDMREAGYDEACIRRTLYGGDEEVGE